MKKKLITTAMLTLFASTPVLAADSASPQAPPLPARLSQGERSGNNAADNLAENVAKQLEWSARVEVEATAGRDFQRAKTSDVTLATIEIGVDANISEWISSQVVLLYEEGEEEDHAIVDVGVITLGNEEKAPFYASAGKMYIPFGSHETFMVSDPLPLELAETRDTAILGGFKMLGLSGAVYAFNGSVDETGGSDTMNTLGAQLGYEIEQGNWKIALGAGWLNNLAESKTLRDHIATTSATVDGSTEAMSIHGRIQHAGWSMLAEYVSALDSFLPGEVDFAGTGAKPAAWQLELAHTTELAGRELTLALGYQHSDEAMAIGLPEHRYLGTVGVSIFAQTTLALEYRHDQDYGVTDGGTDENAHQLVAQLAVEF